MTIDERIVQAVSPVVSEVSPNEYTGDSLEYAVYTYTELPALHAESTPGAIRYLIQVSYYLPNGVNPHDKKLSLRRGIFSSGFTYPSVENASDGEGQHYVFLFEGTDGDI